MLIYPMSPAQCQLHYLILIHLHSTISSLMWLPSPYHYVIIKLQNKQYYLFVYFLEFSKSVFILLMNMNEFCYSSLSIFGHLFQLNWTLYRRIVCNGWSLTKIQCIRIVWYAMSNKVKFRHQTTSTKNKCIYKIYIISKWSNVELKIEWTKLLWLFPLIWLDLHSSMRSRTLPFQHVGNRVGQFTFICNGWLVKKFHDYGKPKGHNVLPQRVDFPIQRVAFQKQRVA